MRDDGVFLFLHSIISDNLLDINVSNKKETCIRRFLHDQSVSIFLNIVCFFVFLQFFLVFLIYIIKYTLSVMA